MSEKVLEQEVLDGVVKEVKAIGATSRENWEKLNKNYKEMKATLDKVPSGEKVDALVTEKVTKLSTDISLRQEKMDESYRTMTTRIDQFETAMKRPGFGTKEDEVTDRKEAFLWTRHCKVIAGAWKEQVEVDKIDLEGFRAYKKSFLTFLRKGEKLLAPEQQKALSVGSDPDGGLLVTPAMSARIVQWIYQRDPMREICATETIGTDTLEMREDLQEAGDGWETETVATAETTTPGWNKISIPVHWQSARPTATQQILDDASIDAEAWLAGKIAKKFGKTEGAAFVSGDGIGKPRGFLTYANGTTFGTIERTNMGAAAAPTSDGLIDLKFSILEEYLSSAIWLMNRLTVANVMKMKDGDGQYIWRPGLQEAQPSMLLGSPLRMSPTMPVVAVNALSVAFADWREAYLIVDRAGITVQRDPFTKKPFVEFYTRRRVGGDVVNFQAIKIGVVAV